MLREELFELCTFKLNYDKYHGISSLHLLEFGLERRSRLKKDAVTNMSGTLMIQNHTKKIQFCSGLFLKHVTFWTFEYVSLIEKNF